ncbi:uncharacterized protein [Haliotis cracherodii]|uniref:uncharacterized protein n=1 Tax=Haliotis cracherodii TaxID=6455 RepID=UPI0039ED1FE0
MVYSDCKVRTRSTMDRQGLFSSGLVTVLLAFIIQTVHAAKVHPTVTLQRLQQAVYDQRWQEYPEYATFSGYHGYDDVLESFTLESFKRRKDNCEDILRQAHELDETQLPKGSKRELRILKSYLTAYIDGYKWRDYGSLNPVNFLEGIAKGTHWTFYAKFDTPDDFEKYLKRLSAFPVQIDEMIALMRRAISLKRTNHRVSIDRVPDILKERDIGENFLLPIQTALELVPQDIKELVLVKAKESLPDISAAIRKLQKFIETEYLKATRPVEGVHTLANGNQYYRACLKWYLGYEISPEEVFELGVKEVARIERQMKRVMESVDFHGDLKSFFQYVKYIPKFYNHTKEELLHRYHFLITKKILPRLQFMFRNISLPALTIVPVDTDGPWGSYGQNVFYANLKEPQKRSTFMMLPLALHETDPGHHFQDAYSSMHGIPDYRAETLNSKLYSVPFHFPIYSAYAEGWALYAEYLGEEMGLYDSPYDLFGRYCSEIFRACRLVVDTGIHAFGWSRDRAIRFLTNYSDFPDSQIQSEVDRYITWPGQACSYKVGEIKIKKLRQEAETRLGRKFNIRDFHHVVLKLGSVPLDILQEEVHDWIDSELLDEKIVTIPVLSSAVMYTYNSVLTTSITIVLLLANR